MRRGILGILHSMLTDVLWLLDIAGHEPATCGVDLEASFPIHSYPRDSIKIGVSTYLVGSHFRAAGEHSLHRLHTNSTLL